jgi:hypothetical protein
MTSFKQIAANRLNARKSTWPRTALGKQRSRCNALSHGLTAETVITALERTADYRALEASLVAEHNPRTATERDLVLRLASVLWRLRRATSIETGLFAIETELMQEAEAATSARRFVPPPQWLDELAAGNGSVPSVPLVPHNVENWGADSLPHPDNKDAQQLAACFLRVSRLGYGTFDLLHRYETALWRQAAQILFVLRSSARS